MEVSLANPPPPPLATHLLKNLSEVDCKLVVNKKTTCKNLKNYLRHVLNR